MKTTIALITFSLLILSSRSQDSSSSAYFSGKKWAVQFEVGNDFKLSSFDGVIVSLKYHLSPKFALRFGAGVNASNSENTFSYREYYYGYTGMEDYNDNVQDVIFISNFLYYFNPKALFRVYIGAGPRAAYYHLNDERIYLDGYKGYRYEKSWNIGLNGVFGCEWFPLNFLSVFGEYSAFGTYGKTERIDQVNEISSGTTVEYYIVNSEIVSFRGNIARLGLSFYF